MTDNTDIIAAAERLFDQTGFSRSGMDKLVAAAGVSSRTLYKRIGNKATLIEAVLKSRDARFFDDYRPRSIDDLFNALQQWIDREGARGCFFLRAASEMDSDDSIVADLMHRHKLQTRALISELVTAELAGAERARREALTDQILVLLEGATAVAVYRKSHAIDAARTAAAILIAQAVDIA